MISSPRVRQHIEQQVDVLHSSKLSSTHSPCSSMKVSCLCLSFLLAVCGLHWTPTTANKIFHFGSCEILMNVNEIRTGFTAIKANIQARDTVRTTSILSFPYSLHRVNSEDTCCIIHHLLKFYVDMVFKHCETEDSWVNRKISSIANSFLSIKKNFRHCHQQSLCRCGEEATQKYKQILTNYSQLNVKNAAMKSLGELDILLDWMEKAY
ncbi:interleukin-20 [Alligator mississippiensis]|uniref:Interleukin family protein n=1 Tax=Alligator mississippiensis TaxID=8496 RepID=A0A151MAR5_ALLMI|nr:interleukin-20 [Alligator mississippiensis]